MASSSINTSKQGSGYDWQLFQRLLPYILREKKHLVLPLILLVPLAFAQALQPVLIGQAISLINQESGAWDFLAVRSLQTGLNILIVMLLLCIGTRLALDGWQSYLVQKVGQDITRNIRNDMFHHVTALSMRFFDRTPVGRLITRLTSDVNALGDVFSTGAIGIFSDMFSIVVSVVIMLLIDWRLGLMLMFLLVNRV
ncbi:MAG: ABC transporter transmembrane domain-containing protein, partial [Cyanobacteria bacterium J06607_17]